MADIRRRHESLAKAAAALEAESEALCNITRYVKLPKNLRRPTMLKEARERLADVRKRTADASRALRDGSNRDLLHGPLR